MFQFIAFLLAGNLPNFALLSSKYYLHLTSSKNPKHHPYIFQRYYLSVMLICTWLSIQHRFTSLWTIVTTMTAKHHTTYEN